MGFAGFASHPQPGAIGHAITADSGEEETVILKWDADYIVDNGSGLALAGDTPNHNTKGADFGGGTNDRSYVRFKIPEIWKGETIEIAISIRHRAAGLSGGGTDDQVHFEHEYAFTDDGDAEPNLGVQNDTSGNEGTATLALGTVQEAEKEMILLEVAVPATNAEFFHFRYNRPTGDANDTLASTSHVHTIYARKKAA